MDSEKLNSYLRAGFPAFWLKTQEPQRVKKQIYEQVELCQRKDGGTYKIAEWNCVIDADPRAPISALDEADELTVMFLYNFHWFIEKPQIIQVIQERLPVWANTGKAIVIVSPKDSLPIELEKDFVVMNLPLPDEDEIRAALDRVAPDESFIPNDDKAMQRLISASKGLTKSELENVLALSLVESKTFDTEIINEHKAMTIKKSGFLEVLAPNLTFNDIIGYEALKAQIMETIDNPKAKGVICIGPPGCGKTSLMKAIVSESGKFGLAIIMGRLFSKWQGETDKNVDTVINLITALGGCFVLIDEFEKQFSGAAGSGELDSGVARRATGRWLDFLQDRPKGVYICATANSFRGIPGEYIRPGRWDSSPFFIDLPSSKVRMKILKHYVDKVGLKMPDSKGIPNMEQWTGAEIEALVEIADMRGLTLLEASENILPQALTMKEDISKLRDWSKGRTVPAEKMPSVKAGGKRKIDA